jgi:hypothetical protein
MNVSDHQCFSFITSYIDLESNNIWGVENLPNDEAL